MTKAWEALGRQHPGLQQGRGPVRSAVLQDCYGTTQARSGKERTDSKQMPCGEGYNSEPAKRRARPEPRRGNGHGEKLAIHTSLGTKLVPTHLATMNTKTWHSGFVEVFLSNYKSGIHQIPSLRLKAPLGRRKSSSLGNTQRKYHIQVTDKVVISEKFKEGKWNQFLEGSRLTSEATKHCWLQERKQQLLLSGWTSWLASRGSPRR